MSDYQPAIEALDKEIQKIKRQAAQENSSIKLLEKQLADCRNGLRFLMGYQENLEAGKRELEMLMMAQV
jgi:hypothetical protein